MIPITQRLIAKTFSQRLGWIKVAFLLIFLTVIVRALHLQVVKRTELSRLANKEWNRSVPVKFRRGPIFDSEGKILAVSLPLESVFAIPNEIEKTDTTAKVLADALNLETEDVIKKISAKTSFTWLKRNTDPATSEGLKLKNLKGVHFLKEYQRFYPMGAHAAQLIGFSGIDSQGLEGIEYRFNSHLMDNSGMTTVWNQLYRNPKLKTLSGGSLTLTIHSRLQYYTEQELRTAVEKMEAKNGVAIVMRSQTGEILSMANMPDYDPNNFDQFDSSRYFNRAVTATYEPGSTFKIITVASALENEVIEPDSIFFCEEGEYQIQDRVIHDIAEFGWLPLEKIIQKSSNICAAKIGQRIPKSVFYKFIKEFGFGSKTNISLPGEVTGKVHNYQNWSDTDIATISFGHTISATPLQALAAVNTIATGGILIQPKIIKEATKADGQILELQKQKKNRVISQKTAEIVKSYMVAVTEAGGTGRPAALKNVQVAGKTGTSRKFDRRLRKYSDKSHITSFIGFFPAEDPKITILVVIDEPKQKYYFTKSPSPIFKRIAGHVIRFLPDISTEGSIGKESRESTKALFSEIQTDPDKNQVPNSIHRMFYQKTLRESLKIADAQGFLISVTGSGKVTKIEILDSKKKHYALSLR